MLSLTVERLRGLIAQAIGVSKIVDRGNPGFLVLTNLRLFVECEVLGEGLLG